MKKNNKNNKNGGGSEKNVTLLLAVCCVIIICVILFVVINGTSTGEIDKDVTVVEEEEEETTVEETTEGTTAEIIDISVEPVELNEELYGYIDTLNTNLRNYFDENYDSGKIITVYGYMYDTDTNLPVETEEIYGGEVPEVLKDVNLLYIKSGDFDYIDNIDSLDIDVDLYDENLSPFTSILTTEGYLISSDQYPGGILSEDDYRTLIMRYNLDHGDIYTPDENSSNYTIIYNLISKEWGDDYTPDIKYMGIDDKYGVAVANVLESPTEFKEFLFMKSGSSWAVRSKELANKDNVKQFVNEKYPDMDLSLLPVYDLSEYNDFKTDLYGYYDSIVELSDLGVTEEDLPAVYCLYSSGFIYYEFAESKRVLGYIDSEGALTFYKIGSVNEAVAAMADLSDNPPVFIIKFS
ncbi:MAG: hypothetical protein LUG24_10410 [Clostridiales bacterium]|nr:hypothetical protein [Clostridiales bacterium]